MATYKCKIATRDGRMVERVIVAESRPQLKDRVTRQGDFLVEAKTSVANGSFFSLNLGKRVKIRDFYSFNQEFAVLLKAGVSVVAAFDGIISKQPKGHFVEILKEIRTDISAGESVSGAFAKYQEVFSPLYIATVRAGETGGDIPNALADYLEYMKKSEAIKQKIKAASLYPAILTVCSGLLVGFLLVFVVPAITGTFMEAGATLPMLTRMILVVSGFIKSYYLPMLFIIALFITGGRLVYGAERGRLLVDRFFLGVPVLGDLVQCYATARFSASLVTVLKSGTTLNAAVKLASDLVGNRHIRKSLKGTVKSLEQGGGFSQSLMKVRVFPDMALRMIAAGEEGGSLEFVMENVADFYESDVEARLTLITSSIEPLLMVLMGFVIGFIVLAMYMPIFQMAGTMG